MNIPLKKRYNYGALRNGGAVGQLPLRIMAPAASTANTISNELYHSRENNNENKTNATPMDVDKTPEKAISSNLCTLTTSIMPTSPKGIQGIRLHQNYMQYAGEVLSPIPMVSGSQDHQPMNASLNTTKPISLNTSTSSAAANTSSSSNQSFALTELTDADSSQSSGSQEQSSAKKEAIIPRYQNKHLTEAAIRQSELRNPGMTTRDRVMYWNIADVFSDIDDDIDLNDHKFISAIRSERLQIKSYQKNRTSLNTSKASTSKQATGSIKKANSTTSSQQSKSKSATKSTKNTASKTVTGEIRRPTAKRSLTVAANEKHSSVPRKRSLLNHLATNDEGTLKDKNAATAIKLRVDYAKKSPDAEATSNFKVPETPLHRIHTSNEFLHQRITNYLEKKHYHLQGASDLDILSDNRASPSSLNGSLFIASASNQEEFYKYLGIDTNPCHGKQSPESSVEDSRSSSKRRQSLRVKIQQKFVKTIAKQSETPKELLMKDGSPKLDEQSDRRISKNFGTPDSSVKSGASFNTKKNGAKVKPTENSLENNQTLHCGFKSNSSIYSSMEDGSCKALLGNTGESKLIKISYLKNGSSASHVGARQTPDQPILLNALKSENKTEDNVTSSHEKENNGILEVKKELLLPLNQSDIVDRRFYEPIDSASSTKTYPFIFPDVSEPQDEPKKSPPASSQSRIKLPLPTIDLTVSPAPSVVEMDEPPAAETIVVLNDSDGSVILDESDQGKDRNDKKKLDMSTATPSLAIDEDTKKDLKPNLAEVANESQPINPKKKQSPKKKLTLQGWFKRYEKCLQKSALFKMNLQRKRIRNRLRNTTDKTVVQDESSSTHPTNDVDKSLMNETESENLSRPAFTVPEHVRNQFPNVVNGNLVSPPLSPASTSRILNLYKENTFSPTSITHSSTSTDSAIGISANMKNDKATETNSNRTFGASLDLPSFITTSTSTTAPLTFSRNPLKHEHGLVLAAFVAASHLNNEIILVVQKRLVSFWKMSPKIYNVFGVPRSCNLLGQCPRSVNDTEIEVPYQNRILICEDKLPVYVEFRGRELPNTGFRDCCLTSIYANVYYLNDSKELFMQPVQLDTLKSTIENIVYITIPNSTFVAVAWTEQTVLNRTRGGVSKYTFNYPGFETLQSITDFAYVQDAVRNLSCLNEFKLVGCGVSTVMMWDHRNGDLLMSIDVNEPIGVNLGCFMMESVDYVFLIQFYKKTEESADHHLLKLLAISTSSSCTWRAVQSHSVPAHFEKITSTFLSTENLAVTFANGHSLLMNLHEPQHLYLRNVKMGGAVNNKKEAHLLNATEDSTDVQVFVRNGQILQISKEFILTKSLCEHFISCNK